MLLLLRWSTKLLLLLRKLLWHELTLTAKLRIHESRRRLALQLWVTKAVLWLLLLLLIVFSSLLLTLLLPSSKLAHPWMLGIPLASSLRWHEALWMLWKSLGI